MQHEEYQEVDYLNQWCDTDASATADSYLPRGSIPGSTYDCAAISTSIGRSR